MVNQIRQNQTRVVLDEAHRPLAEEILRQTGINSLSQLFSLFVVNYGEHLVGSLKSLPVHYVQAPAVPVPGTGYEPPTVPQPHPRYQVPQVAQQAQEPQQIIVQRERSPQQPHSPLTF